jgi:hypothetical protein
MTADLPQALLRFIQSSIPTYQAAEVLLFLAAHPEREWKPEEIVVAMRPVVITVPAVKEYIALFKARGIVTDRDACFQYAPSSPDVEHGIAALAHAYNERPVTLIAAIYRIADDSIQSFADSFKLKDK